MNQIAYILGERFLYWNSIVLMLAAVSAICMFLALSQENFRETMAAVAAVPLAGVLSLFLSRLVHWYCRPQGYAGLAAALIDYSRGGFALIGVFFGCFLTALILRLARISRNLPGMLDHMALAGCLGIAVGRLADLFTTADRGMPLPETMGLPWAVQMMNSVSGETETRLAVFLLQSMAAAVLFAVLFVFYLMGKQKGSLRDGDTCLIFLLCYCACQVVMDSPRYDNLYFRSNGFVSIVQIFGILTVLAVAVLFLLRLVKARGIQSLLLGLLLLPMFGCAGYMEYHVQRHGDQAALAYTMMGAAMAIAVIRILVIRVLAGRKTKAGKPSVREERTRQESEV